METKRLSRAWKKIQIVAHNDCTLSFLRKLSYLTYWMIFYINYHMIFVKHVENMIRGLQVVSK